MRERTKGVVSTCVLLLMMAPGCHDGPRPATPVTGPGPDAGKERQVEEGRRDIDVAGLLKDIHFDFDKSEIRDDAKPVLAEDAAVIKKHGKVKVVVQGHCDERGSVEYNLALGERRAKATKDYLATLGVDPTRLRTVSYGKEMPLDVGHDERAWAQNRRAHFVAVE